ncbi:MAG: hypothetical protein ACFE7E_02480 [Candidatus Hodarchaeota archaeon]
MRKDKKNKKNIAMLGLLTGTVITEIWNSIPKKPKIHVGGVRIHHYPVGLLMMIAGAILSKINLDERTEDTGIFLSYLGIPVFVDDIDDFVRVVKRFFDSR